MSSTIFISHSGNDYVIAKDIAIALRQMGFNTWVDIENLSPGSIWLNEIDEAIKRSNVFLVYIGKSGVRRWVDVETKLAITQNVEDPKFRIIPLFGPGAPEPAELPRFLTLHQGIDMRSGIDNLIDKLPVIADVLKTTPISPVSIFREGESPFIGLSSFDEDTAHLFFGRDNEVAELLSLLQKGNFLALIGSSGSGKSSLLRAGLAPALRRGRLFDSIGGLSGWNTIITRPTDEPTRELAYNIASINYNCPPPERMAITEIALRLFDNSNTHALVDIISSFTNKKTKTIIMVDQFEELFTHCPGPENASKRNYFIDLLLTAASGKGEREIAVVIAMRADFYEHCFDHKTLPRFMAANQYAVSSMDEESIRSAILEPARYAGCTYEKGLIDVIMNDLGTESGNLPLLQYTLTRLWESRSAGALLHEAYKKMKGLKGAIAEHAETIYEKLEEQQKDAAMRIFIKLTNLSEDGKDTRKRATLKSLISRGDDSLVMKEVALYLSSKYVRLLVLSHQHTNEEIRDTATQTPDGEHTIVEVAHEAIISNWPRLKGWLNENRDMLLKHKFIENATKEWIRNNKDESYYLSKAGLKSAISFSNDYNEILHDTENDFIQKCKNYYKEFDIQNISERKAAIVAVADKVTREIRNPLVSIGGFAKRLENKLEGNLKEYASVISNEVHRLEVILKDLLGFVKDFRMSKRDVDLNDIVRGVLELLNPEFSKKRNVIVAEFAEPPLMLFIDPDRIKEAIYNIIDNANSATEAGEIKVAIKNDNESAIIEIADSGTGIDPHIINRIFDPFFTTRDTGAGLGLAISQRIIEEHNGKITVESEVNKGSVFGIYIPLYIGRSVV